MFPGCDFFQDASSIIPGFQCFYQELFLFPKKKHATKRTEAQDLAGLNETFPITMILAR